MKRLAALLVPACLAACGATPVASSPAGGTPSPSASPSPTAWPTAPSVSMWHGEVSPAALPLGDGKVSTGPRAGYVDSCTTNFRQGGAEASGAWLNSAAGTWNSQIKPAVQGSHVWAGAHNSFAVQGSTRLISSNDLPQGAPTGTFPIARSDPAYAYDRNPNSISAQTVQYSLPVNPVAAGTPHCVGLGPIGILTNGVIFFNALDDGGRDAGAHEIQDSCGGHPQMKGMYHYHTISACVLNAAPGASRLIGYALDGYGIYVERDATGNLPGDSDLDACHGRTSSVEWDGKTVMMFHYDVTLEYPYTVGCYHGTPI